MFMIMFMTYKIQQNACKYAYIIFLYALKIIKYGMIKCIKKLQYTFIHLIYYNAIHF